MQTQYGNYGTAQWVFDVDGARLTQEEMEAAVAMVPTPEAEWTQEQVERELLAALRRQYPGIDAMVTAHPPTLEHWYVLAGHRGQSTAEVRWLQVRHADRSWGEAPQSAEVAVRRDEWQPLPAGVSWSADRCSAIEVLERREDGSELCRCVATQALIWTRGILPEVR